MQNKFHKLDYIRLNLVIKWFLDKIETKFQQFQFHFNF
jgi:hypothetical protein